jgi:hypothetical protein
VPGGNMVPGSNVIGPLLCGAVRSCIIAVTVSPANEPRHQDSSGGSGVAFHYYGIGDRDGRSIIHPVWSEPVVGKVGIDLIPGDTGPVGQHGGAAGLLTTTTTLTFVPPGQRPGRKQQFR